MPKVAINYQNALIYKLVCKDSSITDCYVGSTTDFKQRKHCHKTRCNGETNKYHHLPIYKFIRETGGWDNWEMIEIEKYPCNDSRELHSRERYWLETLGATLNYNIPTQSIQEWHQKNYKEYYEKNRERLNAENRQRYYKNRDDMNQQNKEYYKKNRDKILERYKQVRECECGGKFTGSGGRARHNKSMKHQAYLASLDTSQ